MKKKLSIIVLALVFVLSFALVACQHVHTFKEDWSTNESNHWHDATCEHTDEVSDFGAHQWSVSGNDSVCSVCGYVKKNASQDDGNCRHDYVDGVCAKCGDWSSVTDVLLAEISKSDLWNYTLKVHDIEMPVIEDGETVASVDCSGEVHFTLDKQGDMLGYACLNGVEHKEFVVNDVTENVDYDYSFEVVFDNDCVYVKSNVVNSGIPTVNYAKISRDSFFETAKIDVAQLTEVVEQLNAQKEVVQQYVKQLKEQLKAVNINGALDEIFDGLFVKNKYDNIYTWNLDVLRSANQMLASTTVSGYFDAVMGDGAFAQLPQTVKALLKITVKDMLDFLEDKGYTIDDILAIINNVIAQNSQDESIQTVDDLLKQAGLLVGNVTVKDLLNSHAMQIISVEDMLIMMQTGRDEVMDGEALVEYVAQFCNTYKNVTAYDLLAQSIVSDNADTVITNAAQIEYLVDGMIDLIGDYLRFKIKLNDKNVVESVGLNLVIKPTSRQSQQTSDPDKTAVDAILAQVEEVLLDTRFDVVLNRNATPTVDVDEIKEQISEFTTLKMPTSDAERKAFVEKHLYGLPEQYNLTVDGNKLIVTYQTATVLQYEFPEDYAIRQNCAIETVIDFSANVSATVQCGQTASIQISASQKTVFGNVEYVINKWTYNAEFDCYISVPEPITEEEFVQAIKQSGSDATMYYSNLQKALAEAAQNLSAPKRELENIGFSYDYAKNKICNSSSHDLQLVQFAYSETCEQYDKFVYYCNNCHQNIVVYEQKEHTNLVESGSAVVEDGVTCTNGVEVYYDCSDCGKSNVATQYEFSHENDLTVQVVMVKDIIIETNPNCQLCAEEEVYALRFYTCDRCNQFAKIELVKVVNGNVETLGWIDSVLCLTCKLDIKTTSADIDGATSKVTITYQDELIATYYAYER